MSQDQDESQKTEEPTEKKLEDAREKGDVPKSQELNYFFSFMAVLIIMVFGLGWIMRGVHTLMVPFLERPDSFNLDHQTSDILAGLAAEIAPYLLLPMGLILFFGIASGLMQHGLLFSTEPITPKLEKLSLINGFKRMFGSEAVVNLIKGVAKLSLVGFIFVFILWPQQDKIPQLALLDTHQVLPLLYDWVLYLLIAVTAVMALLGFADFAYQKHKYTKKLMMTLQEVKDEFKQTEGDPLVKGRLRQLRMEKARQRMMAAVPSADVVVTNPTHFSVALKYEPETMDAPKVVAKGQDEVALRIRKVAKEHDVMILENPPLARALYAGVEIDQDVPPEHYQAVAEVISYVMKAKGELHRITSGQ
ncbi:flagellar biosynthesis protein FlhB [Kiloniella sp. b19]|uniref:flagellar biosynthesis protein FlhB n=1 Tax=Kiloniella sp. GXU_MW_B19 TaxID=3141326 RepID=UPI0031E06F23